MGISDKSRERLIVQALDAAVEKGIKIWPGATFNWTTQPTGSIMKEFKMPESSGELPSECSALGALVLVLGYPKTFTDVCKYLNVGTYWLYRFHIGFDRCRQIVYKVEDKNKKLIDKEDPTSKMGLRLRKKYVKNSRIQ